MITKITGRLEQVLADRATVSAGALSYEVLIPPVAAKELGGVVGQSISLFTLEYLEGNPAYGQMVPRLVGFLTEMEKEFFIKYITVPGIGIGKGLKSLALPFAEVALAIERRDVKRLASMPGIGRRTADKIVAELNGKMEPFCLGRIDELQPPSALEPEYQTEAIAVLMQLGLSRAESRQRIEQALARGLKDPDVEGLVREAFHTGPATAGTPGRRKKRR